jgi:hypothetical protein
MKEFPFYFSPLLAFANRERSNRGLSFANIDENFSISSECVSGDTVSRTAERMFAVAM